MTTNVHAVIMAGGSGTRFWPASRANRPKQFLPLADGRSLLQATVDRVRGIAGPDRTWIVTNPIQAPAIHGAVADFPADRVVVEPEARDTAPCVALAAACIASRDPDAVMVVMPADHLIEPQQEFERMLARGVELAEASPTLVTFGVVPTFAATGYGYIERGEALDSQAPSAHRVRRFREKPDPVTATEFLRTGNFAWNSGLFVWRISALLAAMDQTAPRLAAATRAMIAACDQGAEALTAAFRTAEKTSIDLALMEAAARRGLVSVVTAPVRWSDVGSFMALGAVSPADADGNVVVLARDARAWLQETQNCVVYGEGRRSVTLLGTSELIVVAVDDAVLVCPRSRAEDIKQLTERLRANGWLDIL